MRHPARALAITATALLALSACTSDAETGDASETTERSGASDDSTTTTAATAPVVLDEATEATLDEVFASSFEASGMPGAAARVTIGDDTWETSAGVDDLATGAPFDADGHVRIASITKSFTGTAVLQLVDEGTLSLDDVLEDFVPGIDNGEEITVRNLLGMTSGIWDFTSDEGFIARFDADPMIEWTPEQTVDLIREHEAEFEPGAEVQYCDSNFVLLGLIIEQVTGQPVHEVIEQRVLAPLGLTGTRFPAPDQPGVPDPHPTGYLPPPEGSDAEPTVVGDINPQVAWTAGAMTSTLDDLEAWGEELATGSLLEPSTQEERLAGQPFAGQKIDFGYGLGITTLGDLVGHNGAIIGYSSVVFSFPEADATFVIVGNESTNFTTPTMDMFLAMVQALYPDQLT